jgi:transcriptional regulator of acetoin/glycerol metabolism
MGDTSAVNIKRTIKRLQKNWEDFIERDVINPDVHPAVAQSWRKCKQHGIDPRLGVGRQVSAEVFRSIREANEALINISLPLMKSVFDIVESSHFLLVLTDSVGHVLETIGDNAIAEAAKDLRFQPGSLWSDLQVGTNALSVCLDYGLPIQMIGPEHYCVPHHSWVCSAAPIHGLNGEVIGCLNMSGEYRNAHPHTLGLVKAAVFGIEQQLFSLYNSELMRTALDGNPESILLLDEQFRPVWANTSARKTLGLAPEKLADTDFRSLMPEVDWAKIKKWDADTRYFSSNTPLLVNGRKRYCSVNISSTLIGLNEHAFNVNIKKQEQVIKSMNALYGNHASYSFADILTVNPAMKKTVAIAERFASYDGNVLIEGEIGSGKVLLAQAIHNASDRSNGPFVTINCASLSRGLVESELFGYEKGFAMGALEDGYPGKFELANHGTLFLSEIDEMPLEYQAGLLQVLQTRTVKRVGAVEEKELDVRVIAGTSHNLRTEVNLGHFRGDLFITLNVLRLNVTPLRERPEDIVYVAQRTLDYFNERYPQAQKTMSEGFLRELHRYPWPGNTRELQNCIERAFYASTGSMLHKDDLANIVQNHATLSTARTGTLPLQTLPPNAPNPRNADEFDEIMDALRTTGYHIEKAAHHLGMSRASLYRRISRLKIDVKKLRLQTAG